MQRAVFGRAKEHRRAPRRPGATRAVLTFNKGAAVVECVVRDFSGMGARVQLLQKASPPEMVYLVYPTNNCAYEANVSWRSDAALGLEFTKAIDLKEELALDLRFLKWVASDRAKTAQA